MSESEAGRQSTAIRWADADSLMDGLAGASVGEREDQPRRTWPKSWPSQRQHNQADPGAFLGVEAIS